MPLLLCSAAVVIAIAVAIAVIVVATAAIVIVTAAIAVAIAIAIANAIIFHCYSLSLPLAQPTLQPFSVQWLARRRMDHGVCCRVDNKVITTILARVS